MINLNAHACSPLATITGGIQSDGHVQSSRRRSTRESTRSSQPRPVISLLPGLNRGSVIGSLPGFSSWLHPATHPPRPHRLRSASLCQQQRRKPKKHCSNRTCLASTTLWTSACSCWTGAARLTAEHHSTISRSGPPFRRPDQQETMVINHHGLTNKTMKKRELEKISRVQSVLEPENGGENDS